MANTIKTRIQLKADTLANWKLATGFIPMENELLLVTDMGGFLRGDGSTSAATLANNAQWFGSVITPADIDAICGITI